MKCASMIYMKCINKPVNSIPLQNRSLSTFLKKLILYFVSVITAFTKHMFNKINMLFNRKSLGASQNKNDKMTRLGADTTPSTTITNIHLIHAKQMYYHPNSATDLSSLLHSNYPDSLYKDRVKRSGLE